MDFSPIEKLAVAQALFKAVGEHVKTKDPGNLRGEVDALMAESYEKARAQGIAPKSFDIEINGTKVGTYSITAEKPVEEKHDVELEVEDAEAFEKWAVERGFARTQVDMASVRRYFDETGEVPDGSKPVSVIIPAVEGGGIKSTSLRVDPEKVARALGPQLEPVTYAFLEGEQWDHTK